MGKRDGLRGLKENVIVGRLIPAGTGMAYHKIRKDQAAEPPVMDLPAAAEEVPAAPRRRRPPPRAAAESREFRRDGKAAARRPFRLRAAGRGAVELPAPVAVSSTAGCRIGPVHLAHATRGEGNMTRHLTALAFALLACIGAVAGPALADGRSNRLVVDHDVDTFAVLPEGVRFPEGITANPANGDHLRRHVRRRGAEQGVALQPARPPRRAARLRHRAAARPGVRSRPQQGLRHRGRRLRGHRLQDPAHCGETWTRRPSGMSPRFRRSARRCRASAGNPDGSIGHDHVRFRCPRPECDDLRQPRESLHFRFVPGRDLQDRQSARAARQAAACRRSVTTRCSPPPDSRRLARTGSPSTRTNPRCSSPIRAMTACCGSTWPRSRFRSSPRASMARTASSSTSRDFCGSPQTRRTKSWHWTRAAGSSPGSANSAASGATARPDGLLFPASPVIFGNEIFVTNLALPLTDTAGDEPEEDVTRWTISRMKLPRGRD